MNRACIILLFLCAVLGCSVAHAKSSEFATWQEKIQNQPLTALQEYVMKPDSNYGWVYNSSYNLKGIGLTAYFINMTSQRWLTDADVSRSIWFHYMYILVPDNLNPNFTSNGLVWITDGHNDDKVEDCGWSNENMIVASIMALEMQTITAVLYQVPNQAICFYEEKPHCKERSEDATIAWTWDHYIRNPTNESVQWIMRLPMTKAGVRAMDATTEFVQQELGYTLNKYIVAGASKRGWTTYTVAACDPVEGRIIGMIPMVLDELNFVKNLHHHWQAYGGWSFALKDYLALNITQRLDSPEVAQIMDLVDPVVYAPLMTMPKLIVDTTGDEFGLPDDNHYWFPEFMGETHLVMFPNIDHSMAGNIPGVLAAVVGFGLMVQSNIPRASYAWNYQADGTIVAVLNTQPSSVKLWQGTTLDGIRRDFRLVVWNATDDKPAFHPVWFTSSDLQPTSVNATSWTYEVLLTPPENGWIAYFIEFDFPSINGQTQHYSTGVSILPQDFPFAPCYEESCLPIYV